LSRKKKSGGKVREESARDWKESRALGKSTRESPPTTSEIDGGKKRKGEGKNKRGKEHHKKTIKDEERSLDL